MEGLVKAITYSDDQLIGMMQNKNTKAFACLYDKYAAALYGSICAQVSDRKVAEDILQQTFLNIWSSITTYTSVNNRLLIQMINVARNIISERSSASDNYNSNVKIAEG